MIFEAFASQQMPLGSIWEAQKNPPSVCAKPVLMLGWEAA